ncbi:MAG: DHA2 family efflux MFS transporter permease subunit [Deltaproteobacteria bacterium]|nr:DHA2 family efflux MFS transporter permease subunit [Deltaproteobacteria bacterium]
MDSRVRLGSVITLMMGTLMAAIDSSIVNISIPSIQASYRSRVDDVGWVVSGYLLAYAVVMPLTQYLMGRLGLFRLFLIGLSLFTVGSLFCGFAPNLPLLVSARVIQAAGGGVLTPASMAVLTSLYPPQKRGRVLGLWGMGILMGPAIGPTLGGVLTQHFGWASIFFVNLPLGVIGILGCFRYVRVLKLETPERHPLDWLGFIAFSVFLIALLSAVSRLEQSGAFSIPTLGGLTVAFLAVGAFLVRERGRNHPLIRLGIFRHRAFSACLIVTFIRAAALYGGIFLLPFLLQGVLGYTETQSGVVMLPGAILIGALLPFSGRWCDRRGARGISMLGLFVVAVSFFVLAVVGSQASLWVILVSMALRGLGMGLLITPLSVATVNSVAQNEIAMVSALSSLSQSIGGAMGVAGVSVLHQFVKSSLQAAGIGAVAAEGVAVQRGFWMAGFLVFLSLIPASEVPRLKASAPAVGELHA